MPTATSYTLTATTTARFAETVERVRAELKAMFIGSITGHALLFRDVHVGMGGSCGPASYFTEMTRDLAELVERLPSGPSGRRSASMTAATQREP